MANDFYFKHRDCWDLYPHPYEIGNLFFFKPKLEGNFFCNKVRSIQQTEYKPLFFFHQQFYLQKHPGQQQHFFKHVLDLIQHRIEHYRAKDIYKDAEETLNNLKALNAFKIVLTELDEWDTNKNLETLLTEKEIEIASYKKEVEELKNIIKTAGKYDAESKIRIMEGTLPALIDLVQQMRVLTLPDGRKFCSVQSQSAWYKMIAKYFQNGEKDIPIDTLRNYFPAGKPEGMSKGSEISKANKLFSIEAVNTPKT